MEGFSFVLTGRNIALAIYSTMEAAETAVKNAGGFFARMTDCNGIGQLNGENITIVAVRSKCDGLPI